MSMPLFLIEGERYDFDKGRMVEDEQFMVAQSIGDAVLSYEDDQHDVERIERMTKACGMTDAAIAQIKGE